METLYVWLFIFAGATMIVVGICLLASERELRKQHVKSAGCDSTTGLRARSTHLSAELIRNKTIEKISLSINPA
jgi:hypothetical protein